MKKRVFTSLFLALAVTATTVFAPLNVGNVNAAANEKESTETNITLTGNQKKAPEGYALKEERKENAASVRTQSAVTQIESADSLNYEWDADNETLRISGEGTVVGNYADSKPLGSYQYQVKKLVLEDGITAIGDRAFTQFYNLQEIEFPSTLKEIGEAAFYGCDRLQTVELPDSLTTLDTAAFADCTQLANVNLPATLKTIGQYVFQGCALTTFTIPDSVDNISALAFYNCPDLQEIQVGAGNKTYSSENGVLLSADKKTLRIYPSGKKESSYTIPGTVTTIGENAFIRTKVIEVTIPGSVKKIENGAFAYSSLVRVSIPDNVTAIGEYVYSDCTSLTSVTIGKGLKTLPYETFYKCSSLVNVKLNSALKEIKQRAFAYCSSLKQITIPDSVTTLLTACFGECRALTSVTLSKNLKTIPYQAFFNCTKLTSVVIPSAVKTIDELAFYGTGIKKARIPASVTYIGANAFPANVALEGVSGLSKMEDGSYMKMEKLQIKVKYDYKAAFEVLKEVNKERSKRGLKALGMDKRLVQSSMIRAAELAILFSHTRPSVRDFDTAYYDEKQGHIVMGENIAAGQRTSASVMDSWMNSSGHKANILGSDYTGIGVGAVVVNGMYYWVQNFSTVAVQKASESSYTNKSANVDIDVKKEEDRQMFFIENMPSKTLKVGTSTNISCMVYNSFVDVPLPSSGLKYVVSSPSVCKVSSTGKITGLKAGKTKVKVVPKKAPSFAKSFTVTVKASVGTVSWKSARRAAGKVQLKWKRVKGATSYQVYRKKGTKWVKLATTSGVSFTHKKAPKNASYKVRAVKKTKSKTAYGSFSKVKTVK